MIASHALMSDEPDLVRQVSFAICAYDSFTRQVVRQGVEARVEGIPDRPIRNQSGLLVFVDLPPQSSYSVHLAAGRAGYFDPPDEVFIAGSPITTPIYVPLLSLPQGRFPDGATLIRGVIIQNGAPVDGARISVALQPSSVLLFETRSAPDGSFAIPLPAPQVSNGETDAPRAVLVTVRRDALIRSYEGEVHGGRNHRFARPLDLSDARQPELQLM